MDDEEPIARWRLDAVDAAAMIDWVDMLGDDNPIHTDPDAAEALGFGPRTVNPGPANLAYVLTALAAAHPGDYPARIDARFLGNVFSGDAVEVRGTCDGDACIAQLHLPDRGEIALEVTVTFVPLPGDAA